MSCPGRVGGEQGGVCSHKDLSFSCRCGSKSPPELPQVRIGSGSQAQTPGWAHYRGRYDTDGDLHFPGAPYSFF